MQFLAILEGAGVSPAECAVLWQVRDTVVQPRGVIAVWTAARAHDVLPVHLTVEDCVRSIDALIRRGLLIELTEQDIDADLARWSAEPMPVSWGVDRERAPGDVDLTEHGFARIESIIQQLEPRSERSPLAGCSDDECDVIRVFGETEDSCRRELGRLIKRIDQPPWGWPRTSLRVDPIQPSGPWWYSRFERVEAGFEAVIRRGDAEDTVHAAIPRTHHGSRDL
ncbi:MAG: hypothetical protein AB7O24_08660 [Kofleriaceae bacterium]